MKPAKKEQWGKKAREWVVKNFSPDVVGKFIEEYIDNLPTKEYDFEFEKPKQNPSYQVPMIKDDAEWILHLYKHILDRSMVDEDDEGFKYWMEQIKKGVDRTDVEKYFKKVAQNDAQNNDKVSFKSYLDDDDEGKRLAFIMPESLGDIFMSTSLFRSIKETYPKYNLYVAVKPEHFAVVQGNPYVHKVIPYLPQMDHFTFTEGAGENMGYFEVAFTPYFNTQRQMCYTHNAKDKIVYDLAY
jgi:hypothetical protein